MRILSEMLLEILKEQEAMAKKFDWKKEIETQLENQYPGTTIKWDGNDPTLVVPDDLTDQEQDIIAFVTALWEEMGGEVKFYAGVYIPE